MASAGASYGGYAALMGAAREPDLYRCAAGYVGVYDLEAMHRQHSRSARWMRRFGAPVRVGGQAIKSPDGRKFNWVRPPAPPKTARTPAPAAPVPPAEQKK